MAQEQIFINAQTAADAAAAAESQKSGFDWSRDYIKVEQAGRDAAVKSALADGCDELTAFTVGEIVKK